MQESWEEYPWTMNTNNWLQFRAEVTNAWSFTSTHDTTPSYRQFNEFHRFLINRELNLSLKSVTCGYKVSVWHWDLFAVCIYTTFLWFHFVSSYRQWNCAWLVFFRCSVRISDSDQLPWLKVSYPRPRTKETATAFLLISPCLSHVHCDSVSSISCPCPMPHDRQMASRC